MQRQNSLNAHLPTLACNVRGGDQQMSFAEQVSACIYAPDCLPPHCVHLTHRLTFGPCCFFVQSGAALSIFHTLERAND